MSSSPLSLRVRVITLGLCLSASLIAGCGEFNYVRVVKKTPTGGELALMAQNDLARRQAEKQMAAQCPQGHFKCMREQQFAAAG